MTDHRASDRRAVFVRNGWVMLAVGPQAVPCVEIARVERARKQPTPAAEHLLAAVAAAWALGIGAELIAAGLETFDPMLGRQP